MKKYRKIPVIIEAIQLTEKNTLQVYTEVFGSEPDLRDRITDEKWYDYEQIVKREGMRLKTPESGEGTQIASIGDYIVFGESEELGRHCWPVKPDYFEKSYEEINN